MEKPASDFLSNSEDRLFDLPKIFPPKRLRSGSNSSISRQMRAMVDNLCTSMGDDHSNKSKSEDAHKFIPTATGKLQLTSGEVYDGQLKNGRFEGFGTMNYNNGDVYVGNWKDNQMNDTEGHYKFKNGNEYRGGFRLCRNNKKSFGSFEG